MQELCLAEEQTQLILQHHRLCTGCKNSNEDQSQSKSSWDCLPPMSIVLYARFVVPDGFTMDCPTLAKAWEPYQTEVEEQWMECVDYLRQTASKQGFAGEDYSNNRGPCPATFSPFFVDQFFGEEEGRVQFTSSAFVVDDDAATIQRLYEIADSFSRGGEGIEGFYDTQYRYFVQIYGNGVIYQDLYLVAGAALVTTLAMILHTRSPFLTFMGIIEISLSFPLAYSFYRFVGQVQFFPFLNLIGAFVVFALGADHVFVAVDKVRCVSLQS